MKAELIMSNLGKKKGKGKRKYMRASRKGGDLRIL
jgi:hypothetical protein